VLGTREGRVVHPPARRPLAAHGRQPPGGLARPAIRGGTSRTGRFVREGRPPRPTGRHLAREGVGQVRLVRAARVFGQVIASGGVGAGTGSAADLLVFADAALPFPLGGIAQRLEEIAVAVNVGERLVEHVAAVLYLNMLQTPRLQWIFVSPPVSGFQPWYVYLERPVWPR